MPSRGAPVPQKGKKPRPIVISRLEDRIVRRSILGVLQSQKEIKEYVHTPNSFGGIENRSVKCAISTACNYIKKGLKYYITSDIKKFFTKIPRLTVVKTLTGLLPENSLNDILSRATKTELENLALLGEQADLFPSYEIGVAQGCCLSPLFGNILLFEFDKELNCNPDEVVCLRYIDDILLLGKNSRVLEKTFKYARSILREFNMETYLPNDTTGKSKQGKVSDGFNYLGCFINEDFIHPSDEKRKDIKIKIKKLLDEHSKGIKEINSSSWNNRHSLINTINDVSNTLMGWGNQYSFCNSKNLFQEIDKDINAYIENYLKEYHTVKRKLSNNKDHDGYRRILGVHLLSESKSSPILPLKE